MANQQHLNILKQGMKTWNQWRKEHPDIHADLREADLRSANLSGTNLSGARLSEADLRAADLRAADLNIADLNVANLSGANLSGANLCKVNFSYANLSSSDLSGATLNEAYLMGADLKWANLSEATLCKAYLGWANLNGADLSEADLRAADLRGANLTSANLSGADITGCAIYGAAAWSVQLEETIQSNLIITHYNQPTIMVENLKIAQFLYLWLNNREIRDVIDIHAKRVVLILGLFISEHATMLNALKNGLLRRSYTPVLFDCRQSENQHRDINELAIMLAHLSRFIIVDLTNMNDLPEAVQAILASAAVPIQPMLLASDQDISPFSDLGQYNSVLPTYFYTDQEHLLASLQENIIARAEEKAGHSP